MGLLPGDYASFLLALPFDDIVCMFLQLDTEDFSSRRHGRIGIEYLLLGAYRLPAYLR